LWLIFDLIARLAAEIFWFQEVGYLRVFGLRLLAKGLLWALGGISAAYLWGNLALAQRLSRSEGNKEDGGTRGHEGHGGELPITNYQLPTSNSKSKIQNSYTLQPSRLQFRFFLPLVLGLNLLVGLILFHYGQVAVRYWHPDLNVPNVSPLIPKLFQPELIWQLGRQIGSDVWFVVLLVGLAIALLVYPWFLLRAIAVVLSAIMGLVLSGQWANVLQYFHPTTFNSSEPVFNRDISFYIFALPIGELLEFWLIGLFLYGFVAVTLTYLRVWSKPVGRGSAQQRRNMAES
jgi:hypothetical protein